MRKAHSGISRSTTTDSHRSQRPSFTCSLAMTVRQLGHQFTLEKRRYTMSCSHSLQEEPLVPAVVGRVAGGDFPRPVVAVAEAVEFLPKAFDVFPGADGRVDAVLDGGVLRRAARRRPTPWGAGRRSPACGSSARRRPPGGSCARAPCAWSRSGRAASPARTSSGRRAGRLLKRRPPGPSALATWARWLLARSARSWLGRSSYGLRGSRAISRAGGCSNGEALPGARSGPLGEGGLNRPASVTSTSLHGTPRRPHRGHCPV